MTAPPSPSSPMPVSRYDARVQLLPTPTMIELLGPAEDVLPRLRALGLEDPAPCRALQAGGLRLLRPAPSHWLLIAPPSDGPGLLTRLRATALGDDTLIVDIGDGWAHFAVAGAQAGELLAIASPLDTHPRAFAADGATFTEAFGLRALLLREAGGFQIAFERSHAPMVADWFARLQGVPRDGPLVAQADFC
ncbi:MAG: sarcosine oxidase subunit gamma family protein [Rubrivivax sp.]